MRVRIQVDVGAWALDLPDDPELCNGKVTKESLGDWVWKHGKDQLLSRLSLAVEEVEAPPEEEKKDLGISEMREESNSHNLQQQFENTDKEAEPKSEPKAELKSEPKAEVAEPKAEEPPKSEMQHHLDLIESLQTVKKDFLERIQDSDIQDILEEEDCELEEEVEEKRNSIFDRNPANIALRELVDSVLSWSGTDYGFLAAVEEEEEIKPPEQPKTDMNDVSELDHSDIEDYLKTMKIGRQFAAVNVPMYDDDDDNDHSDFSSDLDNDTDYYSTGDDDSMDSSERRRHDPLHRTPQPITTYGPVHYKDIPGSVTLMMDQLRFEPVNPLDMLHEGEDEDNSEHHCGDISQASLSYNYMEVYWDKVEKYQLTPKGAKRNLFKLIYRKPGESSSSPKKTAQVILKMKSRPELERIADDVKRRVVLPYKKKKDSNNQDDDNEKLKETRRRQRRRRKKRAEKRRANAVLTPQQRSVMLPPSLPRRMTSERNLLNNLTTAEQEAILATTSSHSSTHSPAPRRPTRRPTMEHKLAVTTFLDDEGFSYDSGDSDDDDDDGDIHLWAVQDLLKKCLDLKRPLTFQDRKRDRRRPPLNHNTTANSRDDNSKEVNSNDNNKGTTKATSTPKPSTALLPEKWQQLVAIPIFYSSMDKLRFIFVLASTNKADDNNSNSQEHDKLPNFGSKVFQERWVPSVTTLLQDLLQHKARLEQLSTVSKSFQDVQGKLRESLRRHSDMIHGILPPMAVCKLKMQPQQWKTPLRQQFFLPKPSVVPVMGGISVDDSSISGSVHSRYGLLVGGVPSIDSASTIATGAQTAESEFGLLSVPEEKLNRNKKGNKKLPERSASTQTAPQQPANPQARSTPQRAKSEVENNNNNNNNNSTNNLNPPVIRGLHRQGSVTNRAGATRPIFSRMGSKRDMMMMRANSARGGALMRMDSAKRGNLMRMDSGRFGRRGVPRLDSLRSLHGNLSVSGGMSVDTFDQSWRTMYMDDESMHLDDLSQQTGTAKISALSQDVSYLTSQSNVKYINSSLIGGIKDVQALYAGHKPYVSIMVLSVVNFQQMALDLRVGPIMDILAKLLFTVDRLCEKHQTIKVEAIGSKIVIMSGLFTGENDEEQAGESANSRDRKAAIDALEMTKEMLSEGQAIQIPPRVASDDDALEAETLRLRAGIHIGSVKYGVLGQNIPKLNCFGDDVFVALRMEQTAPDNYIRVSRAFHDIVGDAELNWEDATEMIDVSESSSSVPAAEASIISAASPSVAAESGLSVDPDAMVETYTLEPPPPAITGGNCNNSMTSFPSLAPWTSSDVLTSSDLLYGSSHDPGGVLQVQMEESFVSGEFDVD